MNPQTAVAEAPVPPEVDSLSLDTLLERSLPSVERWAHGRLPRAARGQFDTRDLVQEAALRMLKRRGSFAPRHAGAVEAYLRLTVLNIIRDEVRRLNRRPEPVELTEEPACERTGPLQFTIREELRARYEKALRELRPKDRRLVVARVEQQRNAKDIAHAFGMCSSGAAGMAINRALGRLMQKLDAPRRLAVKAAAISNGVVSPRWAATVKRTCSALGPCDRLWLPIQANRDTVDSGTLR
jgi:RNA polymerase sigma-70 factor (ECF subfamily)